MKAFGFDALDSVWNAGFEPVRNAEFENAFGFAVLVQQGIEDFHETVHVKRVAVKLKQYLYLQIAVL